MPTNLYNSFITIIYMTNHYHWNLLSHSKDSVLCTCSKYTSRKGTNEIMFPGSEFKKMYHNYKFIKITPQSDWENDVVLIDGLNIGCPRYDYKRDCKIAPGISFTICNDISDVINSSSWYVADISLPNDTRKYHNISQYDINDSNYTLYPLQANSDWWNDDKFYWVRDVEIDNDAIVYVNTKHNVFYANALTLGPRKLIWSDHELCKIAVQRCGLILKFVENKTEELCELAVRQNGIALKFIEHQSEKLCRIAVQQNGDALEYVIDQTDELCELAVQQKGFALQFVKKQTENICKLAVQQNGMALYDVKIQTDEICKMAVQQNGFALQIVKVQTEDICLAAIQQHGGHLLQYVKEQTYNICKLAVQKSTSYHTWYDHVKLYYKVMLFFGYLKPN